MGEGYTGIGFAVRGMRRQAIADHGYARYPRDQEMVAASVSRRNSRLPKL